MGARIGAENMNSGAHVGSGSARVAQIESLAGDRKLNEEELSALLRATADSDESVRESAVAVLDDLAVHADYLPVLIKNVRADQIEPTYWSATLLGRLGPQAATAREVLVVCAEQHSEVACLERVLVVLGKIGGISSSALTRLAGLRDHPQPRVRRLYAELTNTVDSNDA